ncbi:hypothetical protein ACF07T_37335 [Streptomyces sp. NPDC015184]|uniref:hypothetical protein n=1 Tax=Streptomyces sp. NPDC015184 TaxID=3364946 RepID=UPI0037012CBB
MTQHPADNDCLTRATAQIVTVFEQLGAEHKALTAEAEQTTAKERRGTIYRMTECLAQAAHVLKHTVGLLATVHGMRELGISRQFSKDADGHDYSPLNTLGDPDQILYEAESYLQEVAYKLDKAYAPTRKYPGLATARCPSQMKQALYSLRTALETVSTDLHSHYDEEAAGEHSSILTLLSELEDRVCRIVPAQSSGPTADEVAAAIRANPHIARAAAAALKTATA